MGLFDMVLIKDNHISAAGGVTNAVRAVDMYLEKNNLKMEVEVGSSSSSLEKCLLVSNLS